MGLAGEEVVADEAEDVLADTLVSSLGGAGAEGLVECGGEAEFHRLAAHDAGVNNLFFEEGQGWGAGRGGKSGVGRGGVSAGEGGGRGAGDFAELAGKEEDVGVAAEGGDVCVAEGGLAEEHGGVFDAGVDDELGGGESGEGAEA